jgi:hypothetical protein
MNNLEILEKIMENHKFRVTIKGLTKMDFSIYHIAKFDKPWLKILVCPDHLLNYGFLKGFINDAINTLRVEFDGGYKEKYDADVHLRKNLEERILKDPYFMLSEEKVVDFQCSYNKGKLSNVKVKTVDGTEVEFFDFECTNLEESQKALDKHNIS